MVLVGTQASVEEQCSDGSTGVLDDILHEAQPILEEKKKRKLPRRTTTKGREK